MARILVADDNPVSLGFLVEALQSLGHAVTGVDDGGKALDAAMDQAFDLLLLDLRMPVLDGVEVLRRLRQSGGASCNAHALATSADAGMADSLVRETGFADVLRKPVAVAELKSRLEPWLPAIEPSPESPWLDDDAASAQAHGSPQIVMTLRRLLDGELAALPDEVAKLAASTDFHGLRERLHRLLASAGFCGATKLGQACTLVRVALESGSEWPRSALERLLEAAAHTRTQIEASHHVD